MLSTEIKYATTESKTKLTAGKICYQGQIVHNRAYSLEEVKKELAASTGLKVPVVGMFLDSLGECIGDHAANGDRLDFGSFSMALKLRGGFPAYNAPFGKGNSIAIELTPGERMKKGLKQLKPVNANAYHSAQIFNTVLLPECRIVDTMPAEGTSKLSSVGHYLHVHVGATGEGVWIENDEGERLIEGVVLECDSTLCQFEVTAHLKPGLYWLVICSREDQTGEFVEARRRITAK